VIGDSESPLDTVLLESGTYSSDQFKGLKHRFPHCRERRHQRRQQLHLQELFFATVDAAASGFKTFQVQMSDRPMTWWTPRCHRPPPTGLRSTQPRRGHADRRRRQDNFFFGTNGSAFQSRHGEKVAGGGGLIR